MANPTEQAYAELQTAFDFFNRELFGGRLPPCLITLQRRRNCYGFFARRQFVDTRGGTTDELAVNPAFFMVVPLAEILQTMAHEQVHLWQAHFGKPGRRGYHNRQFARKMEEIGLMPSATGKPGGVRTGQKMADYIIPGGPFEMAMVKLLERGFGITWRDRHPDPKQLAQVVAGAVEGVSAADLEAAGVNLAPPVVEQPAARRKYVCPNCPKTSVWGRPKMKVICGKCHSAFVDVEELGVGTHSTTVPAPEDRLEEGDPGFSPEDFPPQSAEDRRPEDVLLSVV